MSNVASTAVTVASIADLGTILSVWAHPDDETYVSGGIMAAAAAAGQRVVCVSATAGELGTDDPQAWPPRRLSRVRKWEAGAAMAVLGVRDHRWLDLPDGGLADLDPGQPVRTLAEIMVEVEPDTILTFGPDGGTFHPDHRTVSAWVSHAWADCGRPGRVLHAVWSDEHLLAWGEEYERWGVYMSDERPVGVPKADLAVDVVLTGALLDQKIAALCAMHTQVAPSLRILGEERFRVLNSTETYIVARG